MNEIIQFFNSEYTITVNETVTETKEGYVSERYSYSGNTQIIELPYSETLTTTTQKVVPNFPALFSAVTVVICFFMLCKFLIALFKRR